MFDKREREEKNMSIITTITTYWQASVLTILFIATIAINLVFANLDKEEFPCMHKLITRIDLGIFIGSLIFITWKGWWC